MTPAETDARRRLPPVDRLLREPELERLMGLYGRDLVRVQVRRRVDDLRERAGRGELADPLLDAEIAGLAAAVEEALEGELGTRLERVLNATGVLLHTNLGRAPLPSAVAERLPPLLDGYCDLELDLTSGRRGDRNRRANALLKALVGCEAGLVVNNNAGALVLILAAHARGREVIVSRGELVEIGGSFRIPDMLTAVGARLVEVGTTNRTRIADYAAAIGPETALLLKIYPSNYRITGFVAEASPAELAALARERGVPLVVDEGSGLLAPSAAPQLRDHPSMTELVAAGCGLVCGSGDKLLGGPQAGLIVGRADLVERCRRHPMYRPLRPDRATFAVLDELLRYRLAGGRLPLDGLWPEPAAHRRRLEGLAERLGAAVVEADAYIGGGSAPERPIAGEALALEGGGALLRRLRAARPPVMGYVRDGRLILDLRTIRAADDELLAQSVASSMDG